ncbi:hypothetical protein EYS42_07600 [Aquabacterium lacunae]|uniref:Uncharacterized protein n=1 Tax=Aquabacterium lacunae TaxID=2528630 RepID=A0A4V2JFM4_9BURK|nr:hypothetical protein [Aquabacterium lacunae]TBO31108.1 hypothetical protein EYS42_07600 [Aquabacterium lacunae]
MSRWIGSLIFSLAGALVTYVWMTQREGAMTSEKIHVLERPMLIGSNSENAYFMLPAGVTLYWDGDMPEGFSRYKVYFNVEGHRLKERAQEVPGAITPTSLQPISKEEMIDLLGLMKLNAKDVNDILSSSKFSDEDRREVRAMLEEKLQPKAR